MKHLAQYIYEGIFDIDKNITDEHGIEKNMFDDYDSDFWKYLIPCGFRTQMNKFEWERAEKEFDIDKEKIWIPDMSVELNTKTQNPFVNKYSLYCKNFFIGDPQSTGPHPDPILDGGGFKEIYCSGKVIIDGMCEKLGGFKFNISGSSSNAGFGSINVNWASDLKYFDASFDFQGCPGVIRLNYVYDFPELKNVKSNAFRIVMYDPSLFDRSEVKSKLDSFFGSGEITCNGITKKKNIRNIVAMVNNIRKYGSIDPGDIIPVGKVSDLIDLNGFNDLETIHLKNNNVQLSFVSPKRKDLIDRYARFIRINNMQKYKNSSIDDMKSLVESCKTTDGWIVMLEPEKF